MQIFRKTMLTRGLRFFVIALLALPLATTTGCKSKKKLAEQQALEAAQRAKEAKIAEAKTILENLLASPGATTTAQLQSKKEQLEYVKSMNLDDPTIRDLIAQVETKLQDEQLALERMLNEAPKPSQPLVSSSQLDMEFGNIASSVSSDDANQKIDQVLQYFSSDNTPVLVIINQSGPIKDYDKPTTIKKYLNYLKDTQKIMDLVSNIAYDDNGKISELELSRRKNY
ncbi:MAG: hypothetical protein AAF694_00710 [Bacteroidota bacterium]